MSIKSEDGSFASDCSNYGMTHGCDADCPVLQSGQCDLQDGENAEIYQEYLDSLK